MTKILTEHGVLMRDAHLACISAFHNGDVMEYVYYYQAKIRKLQSYNEPSWTDAQIREYDKIITFIINTIHPKTKWYKKRGGIK